MAKTAFPTGVEIQARLDSAGIIRPSDLSSNTLADIAAEYWLQCCGFKAWFPEGSETTETLVLNGETILKLSTPYMSLSAITLNGTNIKDSSAWASAQPIRYIDTKISIVGPTNVMTATGIRGYSNTISAHEWEAIMNYAVCYADASADIQKGPAVKLQVETTRVEYAEVPGGVNPKMYAAMQTIKGLAERYGW